MMGQTSSTAVVSPIESMVSQESRVKSIKSSNGSSDWISGGAGVSRGCSGSFMIISTGVFSLSHWSTNFTRLSTSSLATSSGM